jgi:hypothetical protein
MFDWIKNLFEIIKEDQPVEWKTEGSIFNFIRSNIDQNGKLKESANDLPDEKHGNEEQIRFAPGLLDSIYGPDNSDSSKAEVIELVKLIKRISEYGDKSSEAKFYQKVTSNNSVINIIDAFLETSNNLSLPISPYLFNFSNNLAFKTNHRNSVKFGIALLGICSNDSVIDQLKIIGLHDEFTLFALIAIVNLRDNVINDLWEMAKMVNGWGKIRLVDHIVKMEISDEIEDWLISNGYDNEIMYEYLAYKCAVKGKLHEKLEEENITSDLFKSASKIISALIAGGPAEDISVYQYASITIENFVRHAKQHAEDISDFITLNNIKNYLIELQGNNTKQIKNGWTQNAISNCIIDIINLTNKSDWPVKAMIALKSSNNQDYWDGKQAAKMLNIDIWEILWGKLQNNPLDSSLWYDVVNQDKPEMVDKIIQFAVDTIPLKALATGPSNSLGLGPAFVRYGSLDYIVPFRENYPGKGEEIILASLDSPITRNRNFAIRVLKKWGKDIWSKEINSKVLRLQIIEPDKNLKNNVGRLINGLELEY